MVERKQRSDAQQNRERILVVAKEAFARSGRKPVSTTSQSGRASGLERFTDISPRARIF